MCPSTTLSNARRAALPCLSMFLNAATYLEPRTAVDIESDAATRFLCVRLRDSGVLAASGEKDCLERLNAEGRVGVPGGVDCLLHCFLLAL